MKKKRKIIFKGTIGELKKIARPYFEEEMQEARKEVIEEVEKIIEQYKTDFNKPNTILYQYANSREQTKILLRDFWNRVLKQDIKQQLQELKEK